jgi:hypothetical protein
MDFNNFKLFGNNLLARFNEILFYDSSIILDELSNDEQLIIYSARTPE